MGVVVLLLLAKLLREANWKQNFRVSSANNLAQLTSE